MIYGKPGSGTGIVSYAARYDNFIGGDWLAPVEGRYFDNTSPVDGEIFCQVPRSTAADIEMAIDAAEAATEKWAATPVADRADILLKIAERLENSIEPLAVAETWDNGKPVHETLTADLPMAVDHFRCFAALLRAREGAVSALEGKTVAYHLYEPLGVVGEIVAWNFPILLAARKIAPALAAGNCVVLKPSELTPASILLVIELIADLLPPGVLNVVNGFGSEAGKPLAASPRLGLVDFTGRPATGRRIVGYAGANMVPVALELGGKCPAIFTADILANDDEFLDNAVEGFVMFALNQGEVCPCPARALIHSSIYDEFLARCTTRTEAIVSGHPLDTRTMIGAQSGNDQYEKILSYFDIGRAEGARVLTGGEARKVDGLPGGYYIEPTIIEAADEMRVVAEDIVGPIVTVSRFDTLTEAIDAANDARYGLGAGVWTRDLNTAYELANGLSAGRIWTNRHHVYPAHAWENNAMMLDHYQRTKNLLVSFSATGRR
ncbi:aldehyde dehydrogenase family protein [Nocardia camponoti]|uniref:Aldehyde dehydrogenase n=1 Tax=Nocardia camponoti TaxID=1616106 RepID=A0A917Q8M3_9NOCA|nr:aldehyde dehydrogenase family protein [Nocardia camponoti]GGK35660.1 putative aldehyde dehydrogenase [Nocardia camponoti]